MKPRPFKWFVFSAGLLLLLTAEAKLVSSGGTARLLQMPDPILGIPFRQLFWAVGGVELLIAILCFSGKPIQLQAGLIAWFATSCVVYRLGLWWVGYHKPCPCLGNLTEAVHLPPDRADMLLKGVLAYLLIGGYATLAWTLLQRGKMQAGAPVLTSPEAPPAGAACAAVQQAELPG